MNTFISSFLDNDSFFGRFMNKCWIIIAANLTFIIFSIPVITIGPGLVALYHVMLRCLRTKGAINPFKEFWIGFKNNFKQAVIVWIVFVLFMICIIVEIRICIMGAGFLTIFKYGLYAMTFLALVAFLYLLPVIAAFADTTLHLLRNAFFFASKKPLKMLVILFFDIFPLYLTYTDPTYLPLYAFCWFFFGFGALAMLGATLLLPEFRPFLDKDLEQPEYRDEEAEMLDELRELDGL